MATATAAPQTTWKAKRLQTLAAFFRPEKYLRVPPADTPVDALEEVRNLIDGEGRLTERGREDYERARKLRLAPDVLDPCRPVAESLARKLAGGANGGPGGSPRANWEVRREEVVGVVSGFVRAIDAA